jgi:hypothetical protein
MRPTETAKGEPTAMNFPERFGLNSTLAALGIVVCSGALLTFALLPTLPIHSGEVVAAYSHYMNAPSDETGRTYENAVDIVNRPFHILQYISGICGLALPLILILRRWIKRGAVSNLPIQI